MSGALTPPASSRSASGTTGSRAPTTPRRRWSTNGPRRKRSRSRSTTSRRRATRTCSPSRPRRRRGRATTSWRCRPGGRKTMRRASSRSTTSWSRLIKQNGAVNDTVEYLGEAERQVDRGAGDDRQPDQGAVLAHRSDEAACRHRHAGAVSGRQPRRRRTAGPLDAYPQGGRSLPQGRRPVRHRPRPDVGDIGRHRRRVLPVVRRRSWSTPRATSRSRPTRCARRSNTTSSSRSSIRRMRRPGTTPRTTSGWSPARAR